MRLFEKRIRLAAVGVAIVVVLAAGFFVALGMRAVVAGPDSGPAASPPNPGHSWSEIGDFPGTMWHSNNDGSGSGLDADTLDGLESTEIQDADDYVGSAGDADTVDGLHANEIHDADDYVSNAGYATAAGDADTVDGAEASALEESAEIDADIAAHAADAGAHHTKTTDASEIVSGTMAPERIEGTAWTSANDGAGSGLDADLLDGLDSTAFSTGPHTTSLPWADITSKPAGFADDTDDDILGGLSCANGEIAKWNALAWQCGPDVDTDTQLSEGQVETYVTNGPVDLDAATTLGGASISTGPHTVDTDTRCDDTGACSSVGVSDGVNANNRLATSAQAGAGDTLYWGDTAVSTGPHTTSLPWTDITSKPAGFADDIDDDILGGLSCAGGEIAKWNGSAWQCAADVDTDTQLSEGQVETYVTNGPLDLDAATTLGGASISTGPHTTSLPWSSITTKPAGFADDIDDDILGGLSCASAEVAKWDGLAWQCGADVDTDTQLSEAQVETYVTNGPLDLDAATTLGGASISTGPHTTSLPWTDISSKPAGFADDIDDDILGGLSCASGEIAKWDGLAWQCASDDTGTGGFWALTGNSGTTAGTNFVGTTDNQALELHVNSARAFRLEPNATSPNLIGGYSGNSVTAGAVGATIGGGGQGLSLQTNRVTDEFGTVGGGTNNQAGDGAGITVDANWATVAGGAHNTASDAGTTVAGGFQNTASNNWATVGGGFQNAATGSRATIGGGEDNSATLTLATVGGGQNNTASNSLATVGGGSSNEASGSAATVGGGNQNTASAADSTVGGGYSNEASGMYAAVAGGYNNTANQNYATVAGGRDNTASAIQATVGGGGDNSASNNHATVGGGAANEASEYCATVGGGYSNDANGSRATIGGGEDNGASGSYATVGGGIANTTSGSYATVPGGGSNTAAGDYSLAAGRRAKVDAAHDGTFLFADQNNFDFDSAAANEFAVRATGGSRIVTGIDGSGIPDAGVKLDPDDNAWEVLSDRDAKENFVVLDLQDVLNRLAGIPITEWNYKTQDASNRHIGPTAQDFYAAFSLSADELYISPIDTDGVALAAIQGLYGLVLEQDARIDALETRVVALEGGAPASSASNGSSGPLAARFTMGGLLLAGVFVVGGLVLVQRRRAGGRS